MLQRLFIVLNTSEYALRSPRNATKISKLPIIACTPNVYIVPTVSTGRFHSVFTASMTLLWRANSCCSLLTARSRPAHGAIMPHTQRSHSDHSVKECLTIYVSPHKMGRHIVFSSVVCLSVRLSVRLSGHTDGYLLGTKIPNKCPSVRTFHS